MPRGDVAGTGSGSERRACDHSICLFELWSQEIGGPGTSAYYRKTLTVATIEPNPPSKDISLVLIGWTPSQEILPVPLRQWPPEAPWISTTKQEESYSRLRISPAAWLMRACSRFSRGPATIADTCGADS